jgi:hypothetical protein
MELSLHGLPQFWCPQFFTKSGSYPIRSPEFSKLLTQKQYFGGSSARRSLANLNKWVQRFSMITKLLSCFGFRYGAKGKGCNGKESVASLPWQLFIGLNNTISYFDALY